MVAFKNNLKTAFLLACLFGLLVLVGSFWGIQGMLVGGIVAACMNLGAWFFSDRLALAAMHAREVSDADAPELVGMVRRLSARAGLAMPRVYVCPHEAPNAFATGRSPSRAAVAVTRGAMRLLDGRELEGVMAHELAHVKNRDTLTASIAATVAGIFSMLTQWMFFFGGGSSSERQGHPILGILVVVLGGIGAALLQAMISRSREFVADADGAAIAGSPHGLVGALRKLERAASRMPLEHANPAMNNMFIVEPFSAALGGASLTRMFATHPPTEERIAALLGGR